MEEMRKLRVVRPADFVRQSEDQTPGMTRDEVFSTPECWIGVATTEPGFAAAAFHWAEGKPFDSYVYMVRGVARLDYGQGGREAVEAGPGDFVHIPKGVVHREANPGTEASEVLVFRFGSGVPLFNVEGPEE